MRLIEKKDLVKSGQMKLAQILKKRVLDGEREGDEVVVEVEVSFWVSAVSTEQAVIVLA